MRITSTDAARSLLEPIIGNVARTIDETLLIALCHPNIDDCDRLKLVFTLMSASKLLQRPLRPHRTIYQLKRLLLFDATLPDEDGDDTMIGFTAIVPEHYMLTADVMECL